MVIVAHDFDVSNLFPGFFYSQQIPEDGLHLFTIITPTTWNQTGCTRNAEHVTSQFGTSPWTCQPNDSTRSQSRIILPLALFGITSFGAEFLIRFVGRIGFVAIWPKHQLHSAVCQLGASTIHNNYHNIHVDLDANNQRFPAPADQRLLFTLRNSWETQ